MVNKYLRFLFLGLACILGLMMNLIFNINDQGIKYYTITNHFLLITILLDLYGSDKEDK